MKKELMIYGVIILLDALISLYCSSVPQCNLNSLTADFFRIIRGGIGLRILYLAYQLKK